MEIWPFQVGKYIQIESGNSEDDESGLFWIGYGWNESDNHDSLLWLEFDEKTCSGSWWKKIKKLIGSSGKYYSEVDSEFSEEYTNTWIHFYLKEEYLKQFYNEKTDLKLQKDILVGFLNEVLDKL